VAFAYFLAYLAWSVRKRMRLGRPVRSLGIDINSAAQMIWIALIIATAIALLAPPFYPQLLYWDLFRFGAHIVDLLQIFGFALMVIGGMLSWWASSTLGKFMVPEIMVAKDHRLVTEGPYRWIRHPAYTAFILVLSGLSLLYMNPVLGITTVLAAVLAVYRAGKEERLLSSPKAFGHAYVQYKKRTGRFLPRL